jgi:glyoxylase-like metal-dependent hydrolase (beta-lactamase superfamily II)
LNVHHLNCGTMRPLGTRDGIVCHVLLVETTNGLVLIDTGLGLQDATDPAGRLGPARFLIRPAFDPAEAAITRITALGFRPDDVRHVVLTHFDADHTGGLADFPWAAVHVTATENAAAVHPGTMIERGRYLATQRSHGPQIVEHTPDQGEAWRGFPGAEELTAIAPGIVLIDLPGHTRGHAAVAVDAGDHWVLHAGDAFYHRGQINGADHVPRTLALFERGMAHNWSKVRANHHRLTEVWNAAAPDLLLVNAHDPALLSHAQSRQRRST